MLRILVVDDNIVNRELLKIRLKREGHIVFEAVDGQQGLELTRSLMPDLVFMDVMMPRMDGWEACRQIKAEPASRSIPVYMVSAVSDAKDSRSKDCGADGFIAKPCSIADIRNALSRSPGSAPVIAELSPAPPSEI
jgi:CheY-like chemotaxis protein